LNQNKEKYVKDLKTDIEQDLLSLLGRAARICLIAIGFFFILTTNRLTSWGIVHSSPSLPAPGSFTYYGAVLPLFNMPEWNLVALVAGIFAILLFVEVLPFCIQVNDYRSSARFLKAMQQPEPELVSQEKTSDQK
jgi:hypothetical protein